MNSQEDLESLKREIIELKNEQSRLLRSSSYRLGRLVISSLRSPKALIRFPIKLIHLIIDLRNQKRPPGPSSTQYESVVYNLKRLSEYSRLHNIREFVFIFSGTTFIQGTRGNRPIRQTHAFLKKNVPVFFSYHRSRFNEVLPEYNSDILVQSPIDITMQILEMISGVDLGSTRKLYIVSYPYPGIEKSINLFRNNGWKVIYDCRDDWEEFAKVGMARWYRKKVEKELVANVDVTFCVSGPLVDKMKSLVPMSNVRLMPNAVEMDFLPQSYQHMPQLKPRLIGYFGHLASAWFDWDAMIDIANNCPEYQFEIIGHSEPSNLELPSNVQLIGPLPWNQLHQRASRWSVAIIPFRMGPLSDGVDPIKVYEYLLFGLPVVSFRMPQISDYPYTTTVKSIDEFCNAIRFSCNVKINSNIIQDFISRNTWEVRASELLSVLEYSNND